MILVAAILVVAWLLADFRLARGWRILLGICAVITTAFAGYRTGRLAVSLDYYWVPKHNALMDTAITRAHARLLAGDTNSVLRGLDAYLSASKASQADSRVLPAASDLLSEVER